MRYSDSFMEVAFGDSPLDSLLAGLQPGQTLSAAAMLAALEGESEDALQEAFDRLREWQVALDVSAITNTNGTGEAALRLKRESQLAREGLLMTALEETDPLRLYLEEIAAIPAAGDLSLLAEELAAINRDGQDAPELWTRMLNLCLSRVTELACEYTGKGVLLQDLMQEGSMGLWSALSCYEGGAFEDFRDRQIRQAMAQCVTMQAYSDGLGQKMRQAMEDYRNVDDRLLGELGRNPTLEEMAEQLHMSVEETARIASMLEATRNMSRAKAETEEKEPEPDDQQAVEDTAYFHMRQRIEELLSRLDERSAHLLSLRFGLSGKAPMTPEQTGRLLNMTPEEVIAVEAAALSKLRGKG